jgi:Tol biopolymer transport system component
MGSVFKINVVYAKGLSVNSNNKEIRRVKYYMTFFFYTTNSTFITMTLMVIDFSANIIYTVVKDDKQQTARRFIFIYPINFLGDAR